MSGGHFNYANDRLKDEIFGWSDTWHNVFEDREISELVWDVLKLIHTYDYYQSRDTGEESYLRAKDTFKRKWFSNRGVRVRHIVDSSIEELREELYKTFGLKPELKLILHDEDDHSEEYEL